MVDLPLSKLYLDSVGVLREGEIDQSDYTTLKERVTAIGQALLDKVDTSLLTAYDSVVRAINARMDAMPTQYVSNASMTVTQLLANYPAAAGNVGKYARVTDLYGSVDDIMRCRYDGTNYRWVPQREAFSGTNATASGVINILPLITPPTLRATATLTGNVQYSLSTVNAYIGQRQRIVMAGTLGLFTATITGLIGSNISLLGGNSKTLEYGSTGWFSAD